jgi:uracil-DNA glycosylase family 4
LVIVGEGPGRIEEKMGGPFLGQSGKLLDGLLASNGIDRRGCHVTNASLCRGESDKDNEKAAECCAPRLYRELAALNDTSAPIVCLGKTATRSILGTKKLMFARGFIWTAPEIEESTIKAAFAAAGRKGKKPDEWDKRKKVKPGAGKEALLLKAETLRGRAGLAGRVVLPTVHPAFILRADAWQPIIQIDFKRVGRVIRGEVGPTSTEDLAPYTTDVGDLKKLGPVVSLDIETDGVKVLETKMLSMQISDGVRTVVLWPWSKRYAKPVSKFLASRGAVVCHNGVAFDQIVCERHGVK